MLDEVSNEDFDSICGLARKMLAEHGKDDNSESTSTASSSGVRNIFLVCFIFFKKLGDLSQRPKGGSIGVHTCSKQRPLDEQKRDQGSPLFSHMFRLCFIFLKKLWAQQVFTRVQSKDLWASKKGTVEARPSR